MAIWENLPNIIAATGALGTAAYGLVDASKAFKGGISNAGFRFVRNAVVPFEAALKLVNPADPLETVKANWLNGVAKPDQKAAVKSLIRLGLTPASAPLLARGTPGIDGTALVVAAAKVAAGQPLSAQDLDLLGRFDATVDSRLDAGFERAEQLYRNTAKVVAGAVAVVLSAVAGWAIDGGAMAYFTSENFAQSLLIGIIATPLAPIAKDLTSALSTAAAALKSTKS